MVCSQPCHDTIYDWARDALRQLERTTLCHDLYGLATGVVQHLARAAPRQMQFEFLADLWGHLILQVVSKLSEEVGAGDHEADFLGLFVK